MAGVSPDPLAPLVGLPGVADAVRRFAHYGDVRLQGTQLSQALTRVRLVVHDQGPDTHAASCAADSI